MTNSNRDTGGLLLDEIEKQAIEWIVLMDDDDSAAHRAGLDAWLVESAAHRKAYLRVSALWNDIESLRISEAAPVSASHLAPSRTGGRQSNSWLGLMLRAAAPVAALVVASFGALNAWDAWHGWNTVGHRQAQTYSTQIGEFKTVTLEDGSTVTLNTNSEMQVQFSAHHRHIDLTRGEALFRVAKNKDSPFDVEAGSTTVRAVGTAFSVRLHEAGTTEQVDVVVSEGRVAINPPSTKTYTAGSVAKVSGKHVDETIVEATDITSKLAWTDGILLFKGETLRAAVEEFNRYNRRQIQISDPDIAGLAIGGAFHATDPDAFVRALGLSFGVKAHLVTQSSGGEVIKLDSGVP